MKTKKEMLLNDKLEYWLFRGSECFFDFLKLIFWWTIILFVFVIGIEGVNSNSINWVSYYHSYFTYFTISFIIIFLIYFIKLLSLSRVFFYQKLYMVDGYIF